MLGADVAVPSATKFIGGQSDLLCGVVTVRDTNAGEASKVSGAHGCIARRALEAFLAVRGARTLALRLQRARENALTLAERLAGHRKRYPGLPNHPAHEAARRQFRGLLNANLARCARRPRTRYS
jgi:cystathionine gamma-synthase